MRNKIPARRTLDLCKVLHAYALKLTCGNKYLAGDLVLETMQRIAQRATAYHPSTVNFDIWAKMVMKDAFHETVADAEKREFYYLFYHGTLNPLAMALDGKHSLREQFYMMSRMTAHQAAATTLLLNGYALDVIATEMNTNIEGVKTHLANARRAIICMWGS